MHQMTRSKGIRLVGIHGLEHRKYEFLEYLSPLYLRSLKEDQVDRFFDLLLLVWQDRYPFQDRHKIPEALIDLEQVRRL